MAGISNGQHSRSTDTRAASRHLDRCLGTVLPVVSSKPIASARKIQLLVRLPRALLEAGIARLNEIGAVSDLLGSGSRLVARPPL